MTSPYQPPHPDESRRMNTTGWKPQPIVYIVQEEAGKNMTSALEYGSCEVLLTQREEATMLNIPTIIEKLRTGLRDMKSSDFLLINGNPASVGLAFAIASEMTAGRFNILKWDGQERRYWRARVDLSAPTVKISRRTT